MPSVISRERGVDIAENQIPGRSMAELLMLRQMTRGNYYC